MGWVFWQFWLWYSILRAGLEETFRLNPLAIKTYLNQGLDAPGIGLWTDTHIISVPLILLSLYMLLKIRRQPDSRPTVLTVPTPLTSARSSTESP